MDWVTFWPGATEFTLKVGIPGLIALGIIAWGYQFFKNPPWGKKKD